MENNSTGKRNNKKVSYKSCWTRMGTYDYDLEFDLELDLRGYLKVKYNFLNGNAYFWPRMERAGNFTMRYVWFIRSNFMLWGHFKVKRNLYMYSCENRIYSVSSANNFLRAKNVLQWALFEDDMDMIKLCPQMQYQTSAKNSKIQKSKSKQLIPNNPYDISC